LQWKQKPSTILIVKKPNDKQTDEALLEMVDWLNQQKSYNIIIEPHNKPEVIEKLKEVTVFNHETWKGLKDQVDMVITLGGDGSLLHVSSLFNQTVPPIISFSMGTLGFLLPFHIKNYKSDLENFINGKIQLIKRDRLACSFLDSDNQPKLFSWTGESSDKIHIVNEINLHRGIYPHLTSINCYVDDLYLTNGVADGIMISTPTGSTAYSLSAGGPIIHPMVACLLLTPICPRSLSFRPVVLPSTSKITLKVHPESRTHTQISLDGRQIGTLNYNELVNITISDYPLFSANRIGLGEDWTHDINRLLKWNQSFSIFSK
ncbi:ATP-NAD kinase, partial [Neoconidiobolus thromboides FSU 785]